VRGDDALIGTEVVVPAGTMLFRQVPKAAGRPPPGRYEELGAVAADTKLLAVGFVNPTGPRPRMLILRKPDFTMVLVEHRVISGGRT
jgi:hypothetical protein